MEEQSNISIGIKEINEIALTIRPILVTDEPLEFGKNIFIGFAFKFNVEVENELFKFQLLTEIRQSADTDPIVSFETETVFWVQNLNAVLSTDGSEIKIKDDFIATLTGVCVGTTRGMLISATKGTTLSKIIIPLVNPSELVRIMKEQMTNPIVYK